MSRPQKLEHTLSFLLSLSLTIYLIVIVLYNVKLTPFIVLGLFSLLAIYLPDRYQYITIFLVYAPAAYSLYELIMNKNFTMLIELTTGYILSLSFLFGYSYYKSKTPASLYTSYFATYITTLLALESVLNSDKTAISIFYNYIFGAIKRGVLSAEVIGENSLPLSPYLAAISALAFVYYFNIKNSSEKVNLSNNVFLFSLILSISTIGVIVFYSLFFIDSVALSIIFTSASLIFISIYTRVVK